MVPSEIFQEPQKCATVVFVAMHKIWLDAPSVEKYETPR